MNPKKFLLLSLPFILLNLLPGLAHSKVKNKLIDLLDKDITKKEFITLEGGWTFYWKRLLSSEDLKNKPLLKTGAHFKAPGHWTDKANGSLPSFGYGTFLIKVKGAPKKKDLTLTLKDISSSFEVFIVQGGEA